jgi:hypothetical protein
LLRKLSTYLLALLKSKHTDVHALVLTLVVRCHNLFMQTNREQVDWFEYMVERRSLVEFSKQYTYVDHTFYMKDSKIEYEPKKD